MTDECNRHNDKPPVRRQDYGPVRSDDVRAFAIVRVAGAGGAALRHGRNRIPARRGRHSPLYLRGLPCPRHATGQCAHGPRHRGRRPRRHAGVERLSPYGAVLWRDRHWRGLSYHQPSPVPGTDRLHHQSCPRPRGLLRCLVPGPGRADRAAMSSCRVMGHAVRRHQPAARTDAAARKLRGSDRRAARPFRLAPPG